MPLAPEYMLLMLSLRLFCNLQPLPVLNENRCQCLHAGRVWLSTIIVPSAKTSFAFLIHKHNLKKAP